MSSRSAVQSAAGCCQMMDLCSAPQRKAIPPILFRPSGKESGGPIHQTTATAEHFNDDVAQSACALLVFQGFSAIDS